MPFVGGDIGQPMLEVPPAPFPPAPVPVVVPVVTAVVMPVVTPEAPPALVVVLPGSLPADPPAFSVLTAPPHPGATAPTIVATVTRNGGRSGRFLLFACCAMRAR